MSKHQVFFSFEFNKDAWRAAQVRSMGKVSKDSTLFSDNEWEEVKKKGGNAIMNWIDSQMCMRSCIVVLIGESTSTRPWVLYEIKKAYELNKGIAGVYIHGLKDSQGHQSLRGNNPFDYVYTTNGIPLSKYVQCFDSDCTESKTVYNDIQDHIESLIEIALNNKVPR